MVNQEFIRAKYQVFSIRIILFVQVIPLKYKWLGSLASLGYVTNPPQEQLLLNFALPQCINPVLK